MFKPRTVSSDMLGFTLLELVIVITLLAILSVIALPRMSNNYDDAHHSSVLATGGALASAVMLARTQWVAIGGNGPVDSIKGFGRNDVATTEQGWPSDAQQTTASSHSPSLSGDVLRCIRIWDALLSTNGITVSSVSGEGVNYLVTTNADSKCIYTYQQGASNSRIEYDLSSGAVLTILK
ncbi:hypothetical protein NBRC116188_14670 [Oceaniserpentilla sp. 4NH20-0058]|uniref:pilus assembly FimT family protein n=1 Tax=Oceaniserpentilla sp. 4NH20-0058 TaxID=3127660 RepID=UPI00310B6643